MSEIENSDLEKINKAELILMVKDLREQNKKILSKENLHSLKKAERSLNSSRKIPYPKEKGLMNKLEYWNWQLQDFTVRVYDAENLGDDPKIIAEYHRLIAKTRAKYLTQYSHTLEVRPEDVKPYQSRMSEIAKDSFYIDEISRLNLDKKK